MAVQQTDSPRRTQADRRRATERRLLDAAARLIGTHGVQGTSLAAVGEAAGYSRGIVTHHFGSRAALVERLAVAAQERFAAKVLEANLGRDELAVILAITDAYLDGLDAPGPLNRAFFVMWAESSAESGALRPIFEAGTRRSHSIVRDLVTAGLAHGTVRQGVDADAFATALLGQLRGVALLLLGDPYAPDVQLRSVRNCILDSVRRSLEP